ncbi:hypothetical protein ACQ4PT_052886 [Festuca glaucescens]
MASAPSLATGLGQGVSLDRGIVLELDMEEVLACRATAAVSPGPGFAVEEYLVATCGLTRAQALNASAKLSHLNSRTNPDAVLTFLTGLSTADVASIVAKDTKLLCAGVEKTRAPIVVGLTGLGMSSSEIACLVSLTSDSFLCRSIISNMQYYLPLLGSFENVLRVLKRSSYPLSSSLDSPMSLPAGVRARCLRYCQAVHR